MIDNPHNRKKVAEHMVFRVLDNDDLRTYAIAGLINEYKEFPDLFDDDAKIYEGDNPDGK